MKKIISALLVLVACQQVCAQKNGMDSLQAMPEKLFAKGNILNCSVNGYRKLYVYRFQFMGATKPVKALLRHEMTTAIEYPGRIEDDVFSKLWYRSPDVADYLREWTFDIVPATDSFAFGAWAEGVNPTGATDMMYVRLPGGKFLIAKGLDTSGFKKWKLYIGQKAVVYDTAWISREWLPVNNDPAKRQELDDANNRIGLTVYNFSNQTEEMGVARWGNLFFPFYYRKLKNDQPQFILSSIQVGF